MTEGYKIKVFRENDIIPEGAEIIKTNQSLVYTGGGECHTKVETIAKVKVNLLNVINGLETRIKEKLVELEKLNEKVRNNQWIQVKDLPWFIRIFYS